jgi:drug/metabolite transporter (DMT)-like permease
LSAGALLFNTLVWGLSFVLIKDALGHTGPIAFISVRFVVALLPLGALAGLRGYSRVALRAAMVPGAVAGLALFGGYLFQTLGLRDTTAANGGFITGLSVVLVPGVAWRLLGEPLRLRTLVALLPSVGGLALLSFGRSSGRDSGAHLGGDLLVLACAFCFALQIALVARFATRLSGRTEGSARFEPLLVTFWQIATVAAGALLLLPFSGEGRGNPDGWLAAAVLGLVGTAGAYLLQALAQRHISASRTALMYTAEPLFAALFAVALAGERLGPSVVIGGAAIVAGMVFGG